MRLLSRAPINYYILLLISLSMLILLIRYHLTISWIQYTIYSKIIFLLWNRVLINMRDEAGFLFCMQDKYPATLPSSIIIQPLVFFYFLSSKWDSTTCWLSVQRSPVMYCNYIWLQHTNDLLSNSHKRLHTKIPKLFVNWSFHIPFGATNWAFNFLKIDALAVQNRVFCL